MNVFGYLLQVDTGSVSSGIDLLRSITAAGGTVTLIACVYLVHKGYYRHAREFIEQAAAHARELDAKDRAIAAKQAELAWERADRERERKEHEAAKEGLQRELNTTNQQLLSVLETGRRSQAIAKQTLDLASGKAPNVQADSQ